MLDIHHCYLLQDLPDLLARLDLLERWDRQDLLVYGDLLVLPEHKVKVVVKDLLDLQVNLDHEENAVQLALRAQLEREDLPDFLVTYSPIVKSIHTITPIN